MTCAAERSAPSRGYVEPLAQPPSTMPYTPKDEQARMNNTATGRSVTCSAVTCPKIDTTPPTGITAKARKAGIVATIPAFLAFAVIPVGGVVSIFGHVTALQVTDLPVAVLFILACSSFGVYGIVLGGWASGSTYPLLGALRSAAQVISYEVSLALALVPIFLYAGSLSTSEIVAAQNRFWFVFLVPSFVIYMVSAVGETNRAPFDLPEAEGELVGGFHTEYSSLKFALFFLAEYINMTTVSAVATT